jgi:hypothetical protein
MLRHWHQTIDAGIHDTPEGHIARLLDAVEATGLRLHLPGPPRGHTIADRLEQTLAQMDVIIAAAEHAAAIGSGQADIRTHQRGGDQVATRINWNLEPPAIGDKDVQKLRRQRDVLVNAVAYDLSKAQRAISESGQKGNAQVSGPY